MQGARKEIPKEETYNKYGDSAGKVEIDAIGEHGAFTRPFFGNPGWGSVIEGRFAYATKISRFRPAVTRQELARMEIAN